MQSHRDLAVIFMKGSKLYYILRVKGFLGFTFGLLRSLESFNEGKADQTQGEASPNISGQTYFLEYMGIYSRSWNSRDLLCQIGDGTSSFF